MSWSKIVYLIFSNFLAFLFYYVATAFLFDYSQFWLFWVFFSLNFALSLVLILTTKNKGISKKSFLLHLAPAIIFIDIFFLPSKFCGTESKGGTISSCECRGILKNRSLFSTACIGKRVKCYEHLLYSQGGGVVEIPCPDY